MSGSDKISWETEIYNLYNKIAIVEEHAKIEQCHVDDMEHLFVSIKARHYKIIRQIDDIKAIVGSMKKRYD